MPDVHSYLSASASHRWGHCAGSAAIVEQLPPRTGGKAAERGTELHGLAERLLKASFGHTPVVLSTDDAADVESIRPYVEWVRSLPAADPAGHLWLEQRVYYGLTLGVSDDIAFGTADCLFLSGCGTVLTVGDLKTGAMHVSPVGNSQLALYAAGALQFLDMLGYDTGAITKIRLAISQPRIDEETSIWDCTREELQELLAPLRNAALVAVADRGKSMDELTSLSPHEDACRWCPAASSCKALRAVVTSSVPTVAFDDRATAKDFAPVVKEAAVMMPSDKLKQLFERLPLVRLWCDSIEEEANSRAAMGDLPGYKFVEGRAGNRKYDDPNAVVNALLGMGLPPKEFMSPPELLSPPNLEKIYRKNPDVMAVIEEHIVRPPGKPTLVKASDPRPEYKKDRVAEAIADLIS